MRLISLVSLSIFILVLACSHVLNVSPDIPEPDRPSSVCGIDLYTKISSCYSKNSQELCYELPTDFVVNVGFGYPGILSPDFQVIFDNFGWQSFVALNWPAGEGATPDMKRSITDNLGGDRIWERFFSPHDILSGSACNNANYAAKEKILSATSKLSTNTTGELDDFLNAARHPLIDRNNNFVLYEAKVNAEERDYICNNNLNSLVGQKVYTKNNVIDFPIAADSDGAVEVKAAWRILAEEEMNRFYSRRVTIVVPAKNTHGKDDMRIPNIPVGLIGMHIVRKVKVFRDTTSKSDRNRVTAILPWMWATFEHVDNVPANLNDTQIPENETEYSLYRSECTTCPVTEPALIHKDSVFKWAKKPPYAIDYTSSVSGSGGEARGLGEKYGSQIIRPYGLFITAQCLNDKWQKKLAGSVWENYQLISTQWSAESADATFGRVDIPSLSGNTSMESFMLDKANCASCHASASLKLTEVVEGKTVPISADNNFILRHAK